jgi:general secretion pathway protein J
MTLIEVVIALALFSLVAMFTISSTSLGLRLKQKIQGSSDYYHNARTAMRQLDRDISLAYHAYLDTKQGELNKKQQIAAHLYDNVYPQLSSLFKGEKDKLLFSSSSHQRLYKNTNEEDTCITAYYLEADDKNPGLFNLYKRQSTFIDEDTEHGGAVYLIANGIESMSFRYLRTEAKDGDEYWVDKWDSTAGDFVDTFPLGVEVTLVFVPIQQPEKKLKVVQKIRILNPNNIDVGG